MWTNNLYNRNQSSPHRLKNTELKYRDAWWLDCGQIARSMKQRGGQTAVHFKCRGKSNGGSLCYVVIKCNVATEMRTTSGLAGRPGAVKSDRSAEGSRIASAGDIGMVRTRSKFTKSNHAKYELQSFKFSSVKQLVLVSNYSQRITPRA